MHLEASARRDGSTTVATSRCDEHLSTEDEPTTSRQGSPPQHPIPSRNLKGSAGTGSCVLVKQAVKGFLRSLTMSDNTSSAVHDPGTSDKTQSQSHPAPPPFNPMQSSHNAPNAHVHSVVPDLMRVYESLTNGNPTAHEGQQQQPQNQPPKQKQQHSLQDAAYYQEPRDKVQAHPQSQHVNYAYITSEEQYRQLYQHQSGDAPLSADQMSQHHYPGQMPASLPYIPAPYDSTSRHSADSQPTQESLKTSNVDESSSRPSSRSSLRRKRSSISQQQTEQETPAASSGSGKSKSRKKAKETDVRWSKRFTWPEELHRDFVSAVFDVGLKHSSPSTVLEHMPKHPQITSERIKSHLQKYRVHRTKSKQEFMSSYEMTLKKFKSGDMEKVKSLTNGEVAAHLSHTALTDAADPILGVNVGSHTKASSKTAHNETDQEGQLQKPQAPNFRRTGPPPPGHEALMLPKLTEAEKSSPIGASMGYLLGLFFSLKKQLLMQRSALASSGTRPGLAPGLQPDPTDVSSVVATGPVAAVYNSFAGTNMPAPGSGGNDGVASTSLRASNPMESPAVMAATSMDWSSGSNAGTGGREHAAAGGAATSTGSSPVLQNVSTLNNLEASSMMKREMQNQMAFQNKMRALKQQELNKYKHVAPNPNNITPQMETNQAVRFKQEEPSTSEFADNHLHHNQAPKKDQNETADGERMHHEPGHAAINQMPHHQVHHDDGETKEEERESSTGAGGGDCNAHLQGAGETAVAARARAPSFSMGGNDDFWNADVMDEQLFEFLMNN